MQLRIQINDTTQDIEVPQFMLDEGEDFFTQIDSDLNRGYQMSREWVDNPDQEQRCQIVADKILTALSNGNQKSGTLMAAYILKRMPHIREVHMNIEGDMTGHELV